MNKVIITCDSTCDIQENLLNEFGIKIYPLTVNFPNGESYIDGVNITTKELFKKIEAVKEIPHTAAATPGELYNIFEDLTNQGYDVIYTGISGKMSSSLGNAAMIAKEFPGRVEVVDSGNLSSGIALVLHKGYLAVQEGKGLQEVAEAMRNAVPLVRTQFVIDKFDYLHKGGRCKAITKFLGTVLKIHPVIEVRDGVMSVGSKPRGKMTVACDRLLEMLEAEKDNVQEDLVFVTHSEADELAKYLLPKVKEILPNARVEESKANCTVSTHCGPNTIGILWVNKK